LSSGTVSSAQEIHGRVMNFTENSLSYEVADITILLQSINQLCEGILKAIAQDSAPIDLDGKPIDPATIQGELRILNQDLVNTKQVVEMNLTPCNLAGIQYWKGGNTPKSQDATLLIQVATRLHCVAVKLHCVAIKMTLAKEH
jgi:hypothetical protein